MSPEDTIMQLQAEADLLREELEGLYAEKDRADAFTKVLMQGAEEVHQEVRSAEHEQMEMMLVIRRVNQLYGPFVEFERWYGRVRA